MSQKPVWGETKVDSGPCVSKSVDKPQSDSGSDVEIIEIDAPKKGVHSRDLSWSVETHLVYPVGPNGKVFNRISMNPQTLNIKRVGRAAIQNIQHTVCFVDAFPDSEARTKYTRDAVYEAAMHLAEVAIAQRIQEDRDYAEMLSGLVSRLIFVVRLGIWAECCVASVQPGLHTFVVRSRMSQCRVSQDTIRSLGGIHKPRISTPC